MQIDTATQSSPCRRPDAPAILRWADATARLNHQLREAERLDADALKLTRPRDEYRPSSTGLMPKLGDIPAPRASDATPACLPTQPAQVRAVGKFIDLFA